MTLVCDFNIFNFGVNVPIQKKCIEIKKASTYFLMEGKIPSDLQFTNLAVQRTLTCGGLSTTNLSANNATISETFTSDIIQANDVIANVIQTTDLNSTNATIFETLTTDTIQTNNIQTTNANIPYPLPFEIPLWNASSVTGLLADYYIIFDALNDSATYTCNLPTGSRKVALFTDCAMAGNVLSVTVGTNVTLVPIPSSKNVTLTSAFTISNSAVPTDVIITMTTSIGGGNDVTLYGLAIV